MGKASVLPTRPPCLSVPGADDAPGARRTTRLAAAALLAATLCLGCVESPSRPAEGGRLYVVYCASCHGVTGRGDGPLVGSLVPAPSDLTQIALRNDGRFREAEVLAAIDGRYEVAAHGPRDMPVWGAVFLEAHRDDPYSGHRGMDDARALVDYLRTIQIETTGDGDADTASARSAP